MLVFPRSVLNADTAREGHGSSSSAAQPLQHAGRVVDEVRGA